MAIDKGLGEGLAKARAIRAAKKADVPVVKAKVPVPAVRTKAAVSAKLQESK